MQNRGAAGEQGFGEGWFGSPESTERLPGFGEEGFGEGRFGSPIVTAAPPTGPRAPIIPYYQRLMLYPQ